MVKSVVFFFSSRRRHTRWPRDWSLDVCSSDLKELFPDHVRIVDAYRSRRGVIEVDGEFRISILICGKRSHPYNSGRFPWVLRVSERDRNNIGLVCIVDPNWNGILGYYVIPPLRRSV